MRKKWLGLSSVLMASVALVACSNDEDKEDKTADTVTISDDQKKHIANDLNFEELYPDEEIRHYAEKMIGTKASDFSVTNLKGEEVQLNELKGKNVLLELASTSCANCVQSYPTVSAFKNSLEDELTVLTVFANDTTKDVEDFFTNNNYERDEEVIAGEGMNSIFYDYEVEYTPTFVFIDKEGYIQLVDIGGDISETSLSNLSDLAFGTKLMDRYNSSTQIELEVPDMTSEENAEANLKEASEE